MLCFTVLPVALVFEPLAPPAAADAPETTHSEVDASSNCDSSCRGTLGMAAGIVLLTATLAGIFYGLNYSITGETPAENYRQGVKKAAAARERWSKHATHAAGTNVGKGGNAYGVHYARFLHIAPASLHLSALNWRLDETEPPGRLSTLVSRVDVYPLVQIVDSWDWFYLGVGYAACRYMIKDSEGDTRRRTFDGSNIGFGVRFPLWGGLYLGGEAVTIYARHELPAKKTETSEQAQESDRTTLKRGTFQIGMMW